MYTCTSTFRALCKCSNTSCEVCYMTLEQENALSRNAFVIISKLLMRNLSHVSINDVFFVIEGIDIYVGMMSDAFWALAVSWSEYAAYARTTIYVASHISTVICKASSTHFLLQSKFVAYERHENRNKRNAMAYVPRKGTSGGTSEVTRENQSWVKRTNHFRK